MTQRELAASLEAAGLVALGLEDPAAALLPPILAMASSSHLPPVGQFGSVSVQSDDPQLLEKANSGWYQLCSEGGLFGPDREFLVGVDLDDRGRWWMRVRLTDPWDIMGAGAAAVLGAGRCRPSFVMMSVAGDVVVCGMEGQSSIGCLLVREPGREKRFREFAEWKAGWSRTPDHERAAIERWLGG